MKILLLLISRQRRECLLGREFEGGKSAKLDAELYAEILFGLVHSLLYTCLCVEGGEREELYRKRTIKIIDVLFFGPPLRAGKQGNTDRVEDRVKSDG